jgi:CheY-like chemotaxis protein
MTEGYPQILVVDDDASHRLLIAGVLAKLGIEAHLTANPRDFLGKLKSSRIDLCLVDLNIGAPRDGYAIIQALRNVLGEDLPVIVVSSLNSRAAISHAMDLGADDFVVKPIETEMLAAKLSRFVETPELARARPHLLPVPGGGASASLELALEIRDVDEFGIVVSSEHSLNRGSVFHLEGQLPEEISKSRKPLLLTVLSSSPGSEMGSHLSFLEFDYTNEELMSNVRSWLVQYGK